MRLGYDRPVEVVTRLASLSRADQAKILGANAARLLKLNPDPTLIGPRNNRQQASNGPPELSVP